MLEVHEKPVKPLMRYYGGKWISAPKIIPFFPPHRIYCEPFAGAASVLLRKDRSFSEVINDLDGDVINLFRVLQDRSKYADLEWKLKYTPYSRSEFDLAHTSTNDSIERARRLLIRSWMSHSSAGTHRKTCFRTNMKYVSWSSSANDWMHLREFLPLVVERLQGVSIENTDAISCIKGHDVSETLFYVDPPYLSSVRKDNVYAHEMGDEQEHRELADQLHRLKGMVVLSGYQSELYKELYSDWHCETFKSYAADRGKERTECLWLSPRTKAKLDRSTLPPLLAAINETYT